MSLWKKFRELVAVIVLAGAISALIYFGILRVAERNSEKMNEIQEALVDRKIMEEQGRNIPKLREDIEKIELAREKTDVFFSREQIIALVETVETMGAERGVTVVSQASNIAAPSASSRESKNETLSEDEKTSDTVPHTSVEAEEKSDTLVGNVPPERMVGVVFKVTGPYARVTELLGKIDTMPKLLDVLSIEVTPFVSDRDAAWRSSERVAAPQILSGSVPVVNPFSERDPSFSADSSEKKEEDMVVASFSTVLYLAP